ncbi:hypothetical protein LJC56_01855 [Christensenellaceae bacterium OttesenSCG-928-K19]|nr:hypothetical protein [Christensenellaceae bacterium OttesenSCG-928-K19]
MLLQTNPKRAGWRVFTVLLAAVSCACYFFGGAFFASVPEGGLDYGYMLYFCMLIALISSSLLLAIGGTAADTAINYRPVLAAGMIFAAVASVFLVTRDIIDSAEMGILAANGSFNNLVYLITDAVLLVAAIILSGFFLGRIGGKAVMAAAWIFFVGNLLFMVGVLLYFTNGSAFDVGFSWFNLIYPWVDAMGLAAAIVVLALVRKTDLPTKKI